jgi:hypothetical protein
MLTTGTDNRARPGMACSECNDLLVAPKSSAYVSMLPSSPPSSPHHEFQA